MTERPCLLRTAYAGKVQRENCWGGIEGAEGREQAFWLPVAPSLGYKLHGINWKSGGLYTLAPTNTRPHCSHGSLHQNPEPRLAQFGAQASPGHVEQCTSDGIRWEEVQN